MVFAIISSLSITSQLLLPLAGARTSVTSWVTYISALEWKTNQQKYILRTSQVGFSTAIFLFYQNSTHITTGIGYSLPKGQ